MTTQTTHSHSSASLGLPDYWWYRARARLLHEILADAVEEGATILDVGSADGPSVAWLDEVGNRIGLDIDARGLRCGDICASALDLPLADGSLAYLSAFDVIEHFPEDRALLREFHRVLAPGAALLISVPAYQWAWSPFDVRSGHYRRYARRGIVEALDASGFAVERVTHAFAATFPFFVADRVRLRLRNAGVEAAKPRPLPRWLNRALLALCRIDEVLLRRVDLPFGSSVVVLARRR